MINKKVFFLLILTSQVFSQKGSFKGTLLDAKTREPVVYANISFLETTKGISSIEDGTFSMYIEQKYLNGKVHISCLNYKDTIIKASALNTNVLFLKP